MEDFRHVVEKHFRVYDVSEESVGGERVASVYYVMFDGDIEEKIEGVQQEIHAQNRDLLVFFRREGGEDLLFVAERPPVKDSKTRTNWILLALTILTTAMAGAFFWDGYANPRLDAGWDIAKDPMNWIMGFVTFGLPLMLILGVHEMGHYIAARKHRLRASLPFFLPLPPFLMPFGTLGAFIRLKDPLPNRKTLFDVGVAGPIAGFIVAVPVLLIGAALTQGAAHEVPDFYEVEVDGPFETLTQDFGDLTGTGNQTGTVVFMLQSQAAITYQATFSMETPNGTISETIQRSLETPTPLPLFVPADATAWSFEMAWETGFVDFGEPILYKILGPLAEDGDYLTHPTMIAAWGGIFITGFNLLPIGQLDGGHIARAVFGARAGIVNRLAFVFLLFAFLQYQGWMIAVLFVLLTGLNHPPPLSEHKPLDGKRIAIAVFALFMLVVCFVMTPIVL